MNENIIYPMMKPLEGFMKCLKGSK